MREARLMIFGEGLRVPDAALPTDWIDAACDGDPGTVGSLVSCQFEAHLRIWPPPDTDEFWEELAELYRRVASAAERHTSTPDGAWFAIWDGHGWLNTTTHVAWARPAADEEERRARVAYGERLRQEDRERHALVRAALAGIPTIDRPHRRYHVVSGPVRAVSDLREPGGDSWLNPDLWWPEDRAWFVATDVDFWSLYLGGTAGFAADVIAAVPDGIRVEPVALDAVLETED